MNSTPKEEDVRGTEVSSGDQSAVPFLTGATAELWVRVRQASMLSLPASGWKLHVSTVPVDYASCLEAVHRVMQGNALPYKYIASVELLEQLNDGRYGLTQAGKAITIYTHSEREAGALVDSLAQSLKGLRGPDILTERRYSPDAPVYFRYGPFDGRTVVDVLGRKQRLMRLPDGADVLDRPSSTEAPEPSVLPNHPPGDHLAFLREDYLFVTILQVTPKGMVLVAVPRTREGREVLLVKTARGDALADRHGRDAPWALRREHATLQALAKVEGLPPAGMLRQDPAGGTVALIRPYLHGATYMELWQACDSRAPENRVRHLDLLAKVSASVQAIHEAGYIVRDLSPANLLCVDAQAYLLDLELAHGMHHETPPYRRGTRGFYDVDVSPSSPSWKDDAYALLSLAHMAHTGVHPQWSRVEPGLGAVASVPLAANFETAWHRTVNAAHGADFFSNYERLLRTALEPTPKPMAWAWDAPAALHQLQEQLLARINILLKLAPEPDRANVFSGLSGLILALAETGTLRDAFASIKISSLCEYLSDAARQVLHIPGHYFGAPGIGVALLHLAGAGSIGNTARQWAKALLLDLPWQDADVLDHCHGLAGYLVSLLRAYEVSDDADFLGRVAAVCQALCDRAEWSGDEKDICCWPWPEGSYAGLSGSRQYGYAHGTAGILHALQQANELLHDATIARCVQGAAKHLAAGARPLPSSNAAAWWPVDADDETCWNAWSHGTPGVVRALSSLQEDRDEALILRGLEGIRSANNAGYCLCHGIASRLDAYVAAAHALRDCAPAWLGQEALRDATTLAALDVFRLEAREHPEAGDDGYGLMKGAAGVVLTLHRFDRTLRAGLFQFPEGCPVVTGQVLAR